MRTFRDFAARLAAAALVLFFCTPTALDAQVTTGSIVGTVTDVNGVGPWRAGQHRETGKDTAGHVVTRRHRQLRRAVPRARHLRRRGERPGIQEVGARAASCCRSTSGRASTWRSRSAASKRRPRSPREAPLLRTDSSEVGTVIEERAIKELPLNGRNFATLVYLTPGITPGQAGENLSGASTFNPRGASNFNALGHQANANAWLIDGIDNNEYTFNTVIVAPSVEQVREFKVLSGVFSAEFGRGAGVVSVVDQVGQQHAARDGLRVPAQRRLRRAELLRAQGAAAATARCRKDPKPPLDRHQFGGAARRAAGDSRHLRRAQPHVLLRRLRRPQGDARPHVREHRADGAGARRRLQRLPRRATAT